jgi:hypothetical protein
MTLLSSLDMNTGHMVLGLIEPPALSDHSAVLSASTSGYIAITGSGTDRSLAKNAGSVIHRVDTPELFPMTTASAAAVRISGDKIFALRDLEGSEFYNSTTASSNLDTANTLMAFSAAGQLPARADLYGLVLHASLLDAAALAHCVKYMNGKVAS